MRVPKGTKVYAVNRLNGEVRNKYTSRDHLFSRSVISPQLYQKDFRLNISPEICEKAVKSIHTFVESGYIIFLDTQNEKNKNWFMVVHEKDMTSSINSIDSTLSNFQTWSQYNSRIMKKMEDHLLT